MLKTAITSEVRRDLWFIEHHHIGNQWTNDMDKATLYDDTDSVRHLAEQGVFSAADWALKPCAQVLQFRLEGSSDLIKLDPPLRPRSARTGAPV